MSFDCVSLIPNNFYFRRIIGMLDTRDRPFFFFDDPSFLAAAVGDEKAPFFFWNSLPDSIPGLRTRVSSGCEATRGGRRG